jgi:hypothetical protein
MTKKQEYRQGAPAREVFDDAMQTLFQAPKTVSMTQGKKKKRKSKTSARGRASSVSPKEG